MADNPTNTASFPVLSEEATHRNGSTLPTAAQTQGVFLVTVDTDGHVIDLDLRTLATDTVLQAVRDRIGATSSPAAGTLARLLTDILTSVDGLEGFTDGLEALDTTIAARLAGATPHADAAGTGDVALTTTAGRLMSFSARETTGSAGATFYLRDGTGGTIVSIVTLAAGESIRDSFGPNGIALATGLYLDRVAGTTEVTAAVT